MSSARHGASVPRGLGPAGAADPRRGRFGRMFGFLPARDLGTDATDSLLRMLGSRGSDNPKIPAGFTYLGQFIDHDLTFDPTSHRQRVNDPNALVNFRTPRLDLDSLYGAGPADQPYLYETRGGSHDRGVKLLVGTAAEGHRDLPRNVQDRALVGDPRNDENLILAQLHLLFVRFHNRVVEHIARPRLTGGALLEEAQRIVRWHYQWIVAHEYLEAVAGAHMAHDVLVPGDVPVVRRRHYDWRDEPFIPVEFSGAAFRFGHSMVRDDYCVKRTLDRTVPILRRTGDPPELGHLGGFRALPADFEIDWDCFFTLPGHPKPQLSRLIDTNVAGRLQALPANLGGGGLPRRNLLRARALQLPSGLDVARAMGLQPLTEPRLLLAPHGAHLEAIRAATPLWYYVLAEAASDLGDNGRHLGPVGGRIVAEVLIGLIEGDPNSYLRQFPAWRPELPGATAGEFTMADLIAFAG